MRIVISGHYRTEPVRQVLEVDTDESPETVVNQIVRKHKLANSESNFLIQAFDGDQLIHTLDVYPDSHEVEVLTDLY